jgi:hypothetical protein
MSLLLKNNTKSVSKIGFVVSLDPIDNGAFVYVTSDATKAIGVIREASGYRKPCTIATQGEKVRVYVPQNVVRGDIIRTVKAGDRSSLGAGVVVKSGDTPYLRIGEALSSGKGLIPVILELSYDVGISSSSSFGDEFETVSKNLKSYPYNLTYGVDGIDTIVYDLGGGLSVTKTFNYTLSVLTSIVLSGNTPSGIELTKTFSYTGLDLTGVTYS